MSDIMEFTTREQFREWLSDNCMSHDGVWLLLGKAGGPKTIKAGEAFSIRREKSKWSEKNKALAEKLEEQGRMTDFGRKKIEEAKKNGQWNAPNAMVVTEEQIAFLSELLEQYEPASTNFQSMPLSVKKTYARAYFDAKTDDGRKKRIAWMVDRLNKNLKPM